MPDTFQETTECAQILNIFRDIVMISGQLPKSSLTVSYWTTHEEPKPLGQNNFPIIFCIIWLSQVNSLDRFLQIKMCFSTTIILLFYFDYKING